MLKNIIKYLDKITAWIGIVGLILLLCGWHSMLYCLFVLLIVLPESSFKELFSKWQAGLREVEKDLEK